MLCLPVFNMENELIGVTQVVNKKRQGDFPPYDPENWPEAPDCWKTSFDSSDLQFMESFNLQAGVALQKARLFAMLKQQEQMQRDILRSLTNGVISTDKDGKIIAVNDSAIKLLGADENRRPEEHDISEMVKIKEGNFNNWLQSCLSGEKTQQYYPEQTLLSGGGPCNVNLSLNAITDVEDSTKICGSLVVLDDISGEKTNQKYDVSLYDSRSSREPAGQRRYQAWRRTQGSNCAVLRYS